MVARRRRWLWSIVGAAAVARRPSRRSARSPGGSAVVPPSASCRSASASACRCRSSKTQQALGPRATSSRGGEGPPSARAEAPVVDVVGERRRDALRRMEQRDDRRPWPDRGRPRSRPARNRPSTSAKPTMAKIQLAIVEQPVPEQRRAARRRRPPLPECSATTVIPSRGASGARGRDASDVRHPSMRRASPCRVAPSAAGIGGPAQRCRRRRAESTRSSPHEIGKLQ